jgi:hypothetical protein
MSTSDSTPVSSSASTAVPTPGAASFASDEIDLVELLGFFWKIRREIAVGLVTGLVLGSVVGFRVLPVTYKSQIPLSLGRAEDSVKDPKAFADQFNKRLNSALVAQSFWQELAAQSPEFAAALKDGGLTPEQLAARQVLEPTPDKVPLRLRESASPRDFILDISLPVRGLSLKTDAVVVSALGKGLDVSLGLASESLQSSDSEKKQIEQLQNELKVQKRESRDRFLKAKQEFLKVELMLAKLTRGLDVFSNSNRSFSEAVHFHLSGATSAAAGVSAGVPAGAAGNPNTVIEVQEQFILNSQFENIQRMVALLQLENRLKSEAAEQTLQRAQLLRDEIFQLIPLARREVREQVQKEGKLRELFLKREKMLNPSDGINALSEDLMVEELPKLVSSEMNSAAFPREAPVSKRKVAIVLGMFLGAFFGFAVGGMRVFVQKNAKRLKEVVAQ